MPRPRYKPTSMQRRQVSVAAGAGMSHAAIALALDIARGTLEWHFGSELATGAYERRIETIEAMYRTAMKGNVTAMKAYLGKKPERIGC